MKKKDKKTIWNLHAELDGSLKKPFEKERAKLRRHSNTHHLEEILRERYERDNS